MALSYRTRKLLLLILALQRVRRRKRRLMWTQPLVSQREDTKETRPDTFINLLSEMQLTDMDSFMNFFRVTPKQFDHLLSLVGNEIFPYTNNNQEAVSARDRLALTLRYLASGDSMKTVSGIFKVSIPTMSKIVLTVCQALWEALSAKFIPTPSASSWQKVASRMNSSFQFPNCVGALGGKFVKQVLTEGDSKVSKSIVFIAVCDTDHKFLLVDIAKHDTKKTGISFQSTSFGKAVIEEKLDLPPPAEFSGMAEKVPYVFAASERFPLKANIMKPYPNSEDDLEKAVFNYRLSRCRNLIENAFSIMSSRFRILSKPIYTKAPSVLAITMATACLHNYLLSDGDSSRYYRPEGFCDFEDADCNHHEGDWRSDEEHTEMMDLSFTASNSFSRNDARVRNTLKTYFCESGAIPGQEERIEEEDFDDY